MLHINFFPAMRLVFPRQQKCVLPLPCLTVISTDEAETDARSCGWYRHFVTDTQFLLFFLDPETDEETYLRCAGLMVVGHLKHVNDARMMSSSVFTTDRDRASIWSQNDVGVVVCDYESESGLKITLSILCIKEIAWENTDAKEWTLVCRNYHFLSEREAHPSRHEVVFDESACFVLK